MKSKKIFIIMLSVMSLILFIGMIITVIVLFSQEPLSQSNITEFSATIKNVTVEKENRRMYGVIYVEEDNKSLYVLDVDEITDLTSFITLQPNQQIYFGIEDTWESQITYMDFIYITSLRTDEEEIFTLDDYNECIFRRNMLAGITSIIAAVIFFFIFLYIVFWLKEFRIFKFIKEHRKH